MTYVWVLQSIDPEDRASEATSTYIFSNGDRAIRAFRKHCEDWNEGLDPDTDEDMFVDTPGLEELLLRDKFVEVLGTRWTLDEVKLDTGEPI